MRWSMVGLIAAREIKDLLRDRRTLLLVLGLPVLLYPVFAGIGFLFAKSLQEQPTIVGIVGRAHLPTIAVPDERLALLAGGLADGARIRQQPTYPALIAGDALIPQPDDGQIELGSAIVLRDLDSADEELLTTRQVDAILIIPPHVQETLDTGRQVEIIVRGRDGDETSKLAVRRLAKILRTWGRDVRWTRLTEAGLPADFAEPIKVTDPIESKPQVQRTTDELRDTLVKFFPFLLIMWTMAGALHPAIDMTAGEKERGTMETLLISPAERIEIVFGKFLATTTFAYVSAMWNVVWMGGGALLLSMFLPFSVISLTGLIWCVVLSIPLAMLFAAVCLALGVYARSTKEGQYYLMPLFLFSMPLSFYAMAPGVRLSWELSIVPITGLSLLLQQLMSPANGPSPLGYLFPVVGALLGCIALTLFWAVRQFQREGVLFREASQPSQSASWWAKLLGR